MASSKLMASSTSRNSDLKRKLSACASTSDFLRIDSSSNLASDSVMVDGFSRNAYVERNPGQDQGHRMGVEAESSSSTLLNAEITLLDAAGAVTPISDGEMEPRRVVKKTVDDVWREIVAGKKSEKKQPKEEMMTLEDFLVKAGAVEEAASATRGVLEVKEEGLSGGIYAYESKSGVIGTEVGLGMDVGDLGRGRGKRSLSLLEPLDRAAQQRQRRMIKNRESAARSRERKQAYQVELESMAVKLEEENEQLLREKAERTKKRLKQVFTFICKLLIKHQFYAYGECDSRSGEEKAAPPAKKFCGSGPTKKRLTMGKIGSVNEYSDLVNGETGWEIVGFSRCKLWVWIGTAETVGVASGDEFGLKICLEGRWN
ncbi:hypothetical protein DH2020_034781 [Rehmannia glutinosa]|uniref:BZIP domain-containing protein n=1 Tax=Rehmannia glutinosa TaxID=99300 RepID=A0ABR0V965_REHGL